MSAALQLHGVREEVAAGARESGPESLLLVSTQRKALRADWKCCAVGVLLVRTLLLHGVHDDAVHLAALV